MGIFDKIFGKKKEEEEDWEEEEDREEEDKRRETLIKSSVDKAFLDLEEELKKRKGDRAWD